MKRVLIIAAWALGGLVVVLGAAAAYVLSLLSPGNVRAEVEKAVEAATGRDLSIKGEVAVSLWPVFGVSAKEVTLANVAGGTAPAFLDAREIKVGVAIAPLLDRRIEVHELIFERPKLALEVNAAGQPNWVFAPPAAAPGPRPSGPAPAPPALSVHTVRIDGGTISYANAQTGQTYLIDALSADSALAGWDKPLTVNAAGVYSAEDVRLTATVDRPGVVFDGGGTGLSFVMDSAPLTSSFKGEATLATGALKGAAEASGPSLRRLASWVGSPLGEGASTLQAFSVKGALEHSGQSAAFSNAEVALDAVRGRGDVTFETAAGRKPLITGRLELFGLDLNPYLMVAQPAGGAGAVEIAAIDVDVAGWNEAGLDFSGLKALNANVELTISGPLKVQAMQVDSLKADVTAVDGVLTASLSQMQLYGGLGAGRFALNARDMPMTIAHELAVERVRADSFLEALIGFNQLSAPASVRFALASSGGTQKALLENLRGEGSFQFAEGVLRGVDFGGVSRTIGNLIDGKLIGPNAQTPFRGFSAGFKIQQGIAATRDFTLEGQGMRLTALGTIDIGKQTMSLRLSPATVFSSGPDGRTSTGAPLPFVIKGPWTKPEFSIDLLGGARSQVERNVCGVLGQVPGARQRPC